MFIVVFKKLIDGRTEYGVSGAYATEELANEYIRQNQCSGITFAIAIMEG